MMNIEILNLKNKFCGSCAYDAFRFQELIICVLSVCAFFTIKYIWFYSMVYSAHAPKVFTQTHTMYKCVCIDTSNGTRTTNVLPVELLKNGHSKYFVCGHTSKHQHQKERQRGKEKSSKMHWVLTPFTFHSYMYTYTFGYSDIAFHILLCFVSTLL